MCSIVSTNGGSHSTLVTSHTVNMPSGVVSGDRVIIRFASFQVGHTVTTPTGWTQIQTGQFSSVGEYREWYRDCDGSEGATVTVTTSAGVISCHSTFRFIDYDTGQAPVCNTYINHGNSADPDPGPLFGFTSFQCWLVGTVHRDDGFTPADTPTGYDSEFTESSSETRYDNTSVGTFGIGLGSAQRRDSAAGSDPDEWLFRSVFCGSFLTVVKSSVDPPDPPEAPPADPADHETPRKLLDISDLVGVDLSSADESTSVEAALRSASGRPFWSENAGGGHRRTAKDTGSNPAFPAGQRVNKSSGAGGGSRCATPIWPLDQRWSKLNISAARVGRMRYTFSCGVQAYEPTGAPASFGPATIGLKNGSLTFDGNASIYGVELQTPGGATNRDWTIRRRRYASGDLPSYASTATGFRADEPHRVTFIYTEGAVPVIEVWIDQTLIVAYVGEKQMPTLGVTLNDASFGPSVDGKIYTWDARITVEQLTPSL